MTNEEVLKITLCELEHISDDLGIITEFMQKLVNEYEEESLNFQIVLGYLKRISDEAANSYVYGLQNLNEKED